MKKSLSYLLCITAVVACSSGNTTKISPPTINQINTAPYNNNFSQGLFSTYINFTSNSTLDNWQFGFYVARTFYTYTDPNPNAQQNNANTEMTLQICLLPEKTTCAPLQYLKSKDITQTDLSAGYTNILAPESSFPLVAGKQYQVQIINSNQWSINNLSSAPQNLFFVVNGQVINTPTESSIYNLNINEQQNQQAINQFNQTNWTTNTNFNTTNNIIVPAPVNYVKNDGTYTITSNSTIHNILNADNSVASFIQQKIHNDLGINLTIDNGDSKNGIVIQKITDPSIINNNPEGYQIIVNTDGITINALTNAGVFYALQTLRQLWNANQNGEIGQSIITDYPRFGYRGIMLDSSRHFFTTQEVESLIDIAATHKLNTLHWHLSDDEGTRLNLTTNKNLNSRGFNLSMNGMLFIQANLDPTNYLNQTYSLVNDVYSNSYSEEDIKQIIQYANQRNIVIIPEIDSPGHARALIKAFPDLLIDPNDKSHYFTTEGYTDDALPVCTYDTNISIGAKFTKFYDDLFNSLNQLFSNQKPLNPNNLVNNEISVGGDEVAEQTWYTPQNTSCQNNSEFALLTALEKEHLFFKKFTDKNSQLKVSGWQQFIQSDESQLGKTIVAASQVGHVWVWSESSSGITQAQVLAQNNYPVVLDYANDTYFDLAYTQSIYEPGFYWAGYTNTYTALQSAVDITTTIKNIDNAHKSNIKGLEGTLWSENLATYQHLMYMAIPKMAGLSEAAWSPESITTNQNSSYPNWQSLATRLGCDNLASNTGFLAYLYKIYGIRYRGYPNGINLEAPQVCNQN